MQYYIINGCIVCTAKQKDYKLQTAEHWTTEIITRCTTALESNLHYIKHKDPRLSLDVKMVGDLTKLP